LNQATNATNANPTVRSGSADRLQQLHICAYTTVPRRVPQPSKAIGSRNRSPHGGPRNSVGASVQTSPDACLTPPSESPECCRQAMTAVPQTIWPCGR
jgi:hypothetical protein